MKTVNSKMANIPCEHVFCTRFNDCGRPGKRLSICGQSDRNEETIAKLVNVQVSALRE